MTVIAMTRAVGSLGTDIAAGVAKELNLNIIHSDDVATHVAERMGVEEGTIRRYTDGSASILERWRIDRRKLSDYTSEEVLRLAHEGNVVIRGWGAATLLRGTPQVISVRVCAPMAFRVCAMMHKMGTNDADTARRKIERFDAAYTRFMRDSFNVEQEDALLYHLVLNTERLSVAFCVKAICELARHPQFPNFPPNPWIVRDMHGNVWEWYEDNWHGSYHNRDLLSGGSVWQGGQHSTRVLRGGSCSESSRALRSASQLRDEPRQPLRSRRLPSCPNALIVLSVH